MKNKSGSNKKMPFLTGLVLAILSFLWLGVSCTVSQSTESGVNANGSAATPFLTSTQPPRNTKEYASATPTPHPATATKTAISSPTATLTATSSPTPVATAVTALITATPVSYRVGAEDTLTRIAVLFGRSIATIAAYNQLSDLNTLREGQRLLIPPEDYVPFVEWAVSPSSESQEPVKPTDPQIRIIGYSANGLAIKEYIFGNGPQDIILVGGVHGGYEWNTILLAYELIDYFSDATTILPDNLSLHIIPSANPDGQFAVTNQVGRFSQPDVAQDTLAGRFNGNGVDLNRNWDCNWESEAIWRYQLVDGGAYPFSEPETVALRDLFLATNPVAVVFWHSQLSQVLPAGCGEMYPPSIELATQYAEASRYPLTIGFDSYPLTGDASNWLAKEKIPAITIELTTHTWIELERNRNGTLAIIDAYSQPVPCVVAGCQ